MPFNVLFIEDDEGSQRNFADQLEGDDRFRLIQARTLSEAHQAFLARPDWDAIFVDGRLPFGREGYVLEMPKDPPESAPLVREMRRTFRGPIVAMSSIFNRNLVEAGCNLDIDRKGDAYRKVLDLLNLKQEEK